MDAYVPLEWLDALQQLADLANDKSVADERVMPPEPGPRPAHC
jgi:hypothetical protein